MAKTEKLRSTDTEGVYLNDKGVLVDGRGVAVGFKTLKAKDDAQRKEALGADVRLPHELLAAIAFDPRYSMAMRIDCANKAAPYYAAKKDAAGGGGGNGTPDEEAAKIMAALRAIDATVGAKAQPTKGASK